MLAPGKFPARIRQFPSSDSWAFIKQENTAFNFNSSGLFASLRSVVRSFIESFITSRCEFVQFSEPLILVFWSVFLKWLPIEWYSTNRGAEATKQTKWRKRGGRDRRREERKKEKEKRDTWMERGTRSYADGGWCNIHYLNRPERLAR